MHGARTMRHLADAKNVTTNTADEALAMAILVILAIVGAGYFFSKKKERRKRQVGGRQKQPQASYAEAKDELLVPQAVTSDALKANAGKLERTAAGKSKKNKKNNAAAVKDDVSVASQQTQPAAAAAGAKTKAGGKGKGKKKAQAQQAARAAVEDPAVEVTPAATPEPEVEAEQPACDSPVPAETPVPAQGDGEDATAAAAAAAEEEIAVAAAAHAEAPTEEPWSEVDAGDADAGAAVDDAHDDAATTEAEPEAQTATPPAEQEEDEAAPVEAPAVEAAEEEEPPPDTQDAPAAEIRDDDEVSGGDVGDAADVAVDAEAVVAGAASDVAEAEVADVAEDAVAAVEEKKSVTIPALAVDVDECADAERSRSWLTPPTPDVVAPDATVPQLQLAEDHAAALPPSAVEAAQKQQRSGSPLFRVTGASPALFTKASRKAERAAAAAEKAAAAAEEAEKKEKEKEKEKKEREKKEKEEADKTMIAGRTGPGSSTSANTLPVTAHENGGGSAFGWRSGVDVTRVRRELQVDSWRGQQRAVDADRASASTPSPSETRGQMRSLHRVDSSDDGSRHTRPRSSPPASRVENPSPATLDNSNGPPTLDSQRSSQASPIPWGSASPKAGRLHPIPSTTSSANGSTHNGGKDAQEVSPTAKAARRAAGAAPAVGKAAAAVVPDRGMMGEALGKQQQQQQQQQTPPVVPAVPMALPPTAAAAQTANSSILNPAKLYVPRSSAADRRGSSEGTPVAHPHHPPPTAAAPQLNTTAPMATPVMHAHAANTSTAPVYPPVPAPGAYVGVPLNQTTYAAPQSNSSFSGSAGSTPAQAVSQTPPLPMCPNDGSCSMVNDQCHQNQFRHTCQIANCQHAHLEYHTRLFVHFDPGWITVFNTEAYTFIEIRPRNTWAKVKVAQIKKLVSDRMGLPEDRQALCKQDPRRPGAQIYLLDDNASCADYHISNGDHLFVTPVRTNHTADEFISMSMASAAPFHPAGAPPTTIPHAGRTEQGGWDQDVTESGFDGASYGY